MTQIPTTSIVGLCTVKTYTVVALLVYKVCAQSHMYKYTLVCRHNITKYTHLVPASISRIQLTSNNPSRLVVSLGFSELPLCSSTVSVWFRTFLASVHPHSLVVGVGWHLQCFHSVWRWHSSSFCICWPSTSPREVVGADWISGGLGKLAWGRSPVVGGQSIGELAGVTGHLPPPTSWALCAASMLFPHHSRAVLVARCRVSSRSQGGWSVYGRARLCWGCYGQWVSWQGRGVY